MVLYEGSRVNLTVQVSSNLSLTKIPTWSRKHAVLPNDSFTVNYSIDGNNFTALIINKVSFSNDKGVYLLNASNYCGLSSTSTDITIVKSERA